MPRGAINQYKKERSRKREISCNIKYVTCVVEHPSQKNMEGHGRNRSLSVLRRGNKKQKTKDTKNTVWWFINEGWNIHKIKQRKTLI